MNAMGNEKETFQVEVMCRGGGAPHTHVLVVQRGQIVHGAARPTTVRLQYTCPASNTAFIAHVDPPVGAGRPFEVLQVI
jgi:hypothetical protein